MPGSSDPAQLALWTGFERTLLGRLPEAARVVTTWEDLYPRETWRAFLERQGYAQVGPAAFAKERP